MTRKIQSRIQVFLLIFGPVLLALALALNRWYACIPLLGFVTWMIIRWLPPRDETPKKSSAEKMSERFLVKHNGARCD